MVLSLGEKIRNLREEKGINQTQLGKELNMTQRKISYIECGKYEPSIDDIRLFCNYFQVSSDYLIGIKKGVVLSRKIKPSSRFLSTVIFIMCLLNCRRQFGRASNLFHREAIAHPGKQIA
ncbi:MAG: helix-turn-helix transcriptional regulator [Clostridia bacterium]|nr:helix-turn-helix transcriptional regulator [Clostridia bacterium]